jgi:hypothetical protein
LAAGLVLAGAVADGDDDGTAAVGASLALEGAAGGAVAVVGPVVLLPDCGSVVEPLPGNAFCGAISGVAVVVALAGVTALAVPLIVALGGIGALPC